jgi:hypothetical protein
MSTPLCPACGWPIPPPPQLCECGHSAAGHDLNAAGRRTHCFHISPAGRCPCRHYRETPPTQATGPAQGQAGNHTTGE